MVLWLRGFRIELAALQLCRCLCRCRKVVSTSCDILDAFLLCAVAGLCAVGCRCSFPTHRRVASALDLALHRRRRYSQLTGWYAAGRDLGGVVVASGSHLLTECAARYRHAITSMPSMLDVRNAQRSAFCHDRAPRWLDPT
jgi:hypothetical protein